MRFSIDSQELLNKLALLSGVLSTNTSLPILDNFLFESNNGHVKITASDIDNTLTCNLKIEESVTFNVAVPGKLLIDILKSFPQQPLTFEILENNTIEISSLSGNYSIAYFNGLEYPRVKELEDPTSINLTADVLSNAINLVLFATGNDDIRQFMNGILFDINRERTVFVATDAHKLSKYVRKDITCEKEAQFIVPKKPLQILKSAFSKGEEQIEIIYNNSNACFKFKDYQLNCRLIDYKYPAYDSVIPKENDKQLIVDKSKLLSALKCINIFSNKTTHQVKFEIKGNNIHLQAEDKDYSNKGDENIPCNFTGSDITIGFNAKYFIETLSNIDSEEVLIELSMPNRAGIVRPNQGLNKEKEEVTMLIMPVILQ